jgi:diadenosine tetraphosphate (Ap4A) HIT family hydrolase
MPTPADCPFCDPRARWREDLFIAEMPGAWLYLCDDQAFPAWSVAIAKRHATDLFELEGDERAQFLDACASLSRAVRAVAGAAHMNYASLGNVVRHLHVHCIPRRPDDPHWGAAPWPHEAVAPDPEQARATIARLRDALA